LNKALDEIEAGNFDVVTDVEAPTVHEPAREAALQELTAQAQELGMGY
jgi:hypothetical protein